MAGSPTLSIDEKPTPTTTVSPATPPTTRYSFLIRPYNGYTLSLARRIQSTPRPQTFLYEGSYGHSPNLSRFTDICYIIGGSGVSVAISGIYRALDVNPTVRITLVWASRTKFLIDSVLGRELKAAVDTGRVVVHAHVTHTQNASIPAEKVTETLVAKRPSVQEIMDEAIQGSAGALAVVACGPAGMMDDARRAFAGALARESGDVELFLEAFNW